MDEHIMKLLKTLLLSTLVFGLLSCDLLESPTPQQSLDSEIVLNSPEGLRDILTGLYDGLQSANISGGEYNYTAELLGDNIVWSGSFTGFQNIEQRNLQADNPSFNGWWNISFREINAANILLQKVQEVEDPTFTEAEKNLIRGEAHLARGMLYFQMAYMFAKPFWDDPSALAVPIRTTPVLGVPDFDNLERRPLSEVLSQAEQDLVQASNLLPNVTLRSNRRATRYAALAYLMRLEMVRMNYTAAAGHAQTIMNAGFSLTADPGAPFANEFSSESIFEIVHTSQDNPGVNGGQNAFYTPGNLGGRGDIQISESYVTALGQIITDSQQANIDGAGFTVQDLRINLLNGLTPQTSATIKFPDGTNNADNVMNSRFAEVLLTRAEALAEAAADLANVPQEAFDLLNQIRARSLVVTDANGNAQGSALIEFTPADFNNKQELIDAILLERRIELAFEGDRFYTLKRKGIPVINRAGTFQTNDPCMIFQIPQGEIDANPNMVQNPTC
jgi:hypothetical protein